MPEIGWHFYGDLGKIDVGMAELKVVGRTHRKVKTIERLRVESMKRQIEEVIDCLEGRREQHRGDAKLGYAALEVLIGLLESARLGDVVNMPVTQTRYPLDIMVGQPAPGSARPQQQQAAR